MKRKWFWVVLAVIVGAAVYGGDVLATPSSNFAGTTLAKATLGELDVRAHTTVPADPGNGSVPANVWETLLKTNGSTDLYVQQNTWQPGGSTGWHTHPGPSLVIVTQGTLTVYDSSDPTCAPQVYSAGGSNEFVDVGSGDVHLIRNESGDIAKTVAVQFVPAGATRRIDAPQPPNCSAS
jgi:quercetin dioxygenase-like cupin family protein